MSWPKIGATLYTQLEVQDKGSCNQQVGCLYSLQRLYSCTVSVRFDLELHKNLIGSKQHHFKGQSNDLFTHDIPKKLHELSALSSAYQTKTRDYKF